MTAGTIDDNSTLIDYALQSDDFLEQLCPMIKTQLVTEGSLDSMIDSFQKYTIKSENNLSDTSMHIIGDLVSSMTTIKSVVSKSHQLSREIDIVSSNVNKTGEELIKVKRSLVELNQVEERIAQTDQIVSNCLKILNKTNNVLSLIQKLDFFKALKELNQLLNEDELDMEYQFVNKIYDSIPLFQKMIIDESLEQLNSWLNIQVLKSFSDMGELLFETFEDINMDWEMKQMDDLNLIDYKVNSSIELIFREFKYTNLNPIEKIGLDMTPLYHAYLVFKEIDDLESLNENLSNGMLKLKDTLLLPFLEKNSITNNDSLKINLYLISSLIVFDKLVSMNTDYLIRSEKVVLSSNNSLLVKINNVLSKYIIKISSEVNNLTKFERLNQTLGIFNQILNNYDFQSEDTIYSLIILNFDEYLKSLFQSFKSQYNQLIEQELWQGFPINDEDTYKIIKSQVFHMFKIDNPSFPVIAPFSKIYIESCKLLRQTVLKIYQFVSRYFDHNLNEIVSKINDFIDLILEKIILKDLEIQMKSAYESVKSQNLINLDFFCSSNYELEKWINLSSNGILMKFRSPTKQVKLRVKDKFEIVKHNAEVNLLTGMNEMLSNLIDSNNLSWIESYWSNPVLEKAPNDDIDMALGFIYDHFNLKFGNLPGHTKASLLLEAIDKICLLLLETITKVDFISLNALKNFQLDIQNVDKTIDKFYQGHIVNDYDINSEVLKNVTIELKQIVKVLNMLDVEVIKDGGTKMKLTEDDLKKLLGKYEGYQLYLEEERQKKMMHQQQQHQSLHPQSRPQSRTPSTNSPLLKLQRQQQQTVEDDNRSIFSFKY